MQQGYKICYGWYMRHGAYRLGINPLFFNLYNHKTVKFLSLTWRLPFAYLNVLYFREI